MRLKVKNPFHNKPYSDELILSLYQRGFTLIEVLIAMTLLSIMVVLLFTSLKICADSWEKGEKKIAEVNEVAVVYNFFQRHLSSAKPVWDDFIPEKKTFSFQGDAQSLQFVSEFPASAGKVGLQVFSVKLVEEDHQRFIRVTLTPFLPVAEGEELEKEEVVLVNHVRDFNLAYFSLNPGASEGTWQNEWLERETQPQLVRVYIDLDNDIYWPEMVFEIKIAGTPDAIENINVEAQ